MFAKDYRKQDIDELIAKLAELKGGLAELEFNVRLGQESDTAQLREKRREIARVMTVLSEKSEVGGQTTEVAEEKEEGK